MDAYNKLLNEINIILNEEDVEFNDNQISLYDLYNIVNSHFEDLRDLYSSKILFIHNEPFHIKAYKKYVFTIRKECLELSIYFQEFLTEGFRISKDRESNNIYINKLGAPEKKINNFMKKHYDEIMSVFQMLEKYEENKNYEMNDFSHKNYSFKLFTFYDGDVTLNIFFNDNYNNRNNMKEVFNRQYYGKDKLSDLVQNYKFEMAKKVPVTIDTLPPAIIKMIEKKKQKSKTMRFGCVVK